MRVVRARVYRRNGQWSYDFFDGRDYLTSCPHGTWREAFDAARQTVRDAIAFGPSRLA